jgi:hypothetical protein
LTYVNGILILQPKRINTFSTEHIYFQGKPCAKVSRGVFEKSDGRFALSSESILLFGSAQETSMPGIKVKYVKISVGALTNEEVRGMHGKIVDSALLRRNTRLK